MKSVKEIRTHYANEATKKLGREITSNDVHIIKGVVKPNYNLTEILKMDSSHMRSHKPVSIIVETMPDGQIRHKIHIMD